MNHLESMYMPGAPPPRRWTVGRLMVLVAGLGVGLAIATTIFKTGRERLRTFTCAVNMRRIEIAILSYQGAKGHLPPAYIADPSGRPLLSWRVLILPYMDISGLPAFRLDEPWDSPFNLRILDQIPDDLFTCPEHRHGKLGGTSCGHASYFTLRGPATAFPGATPVRFDQISDDRNRTLLFIESDQDGVPWSAPVDIDAATGRLTGAAPTDPSALISPHKSGLHIDTTECSIYSLAPEKLQQSLTPLSTINGGEAIQVKIP